MTFATNATSLITTETLLKNWQGHRGLTRSTIDAFPEDKLFHFSLGGMRSFGEMSLELLNMTGPLVDGVSTGKWTEYAVPQLKTKAEVLDAWDKETAALDDKFLGIPPNRFFEVDKAFGQWEMTGLAMIQYAIDNEIHHRGEGFVYLRALGIEPPHFWDR